MQHFYNRQSEIEALIKIHKTSTQHARFTYISGPRRIGKTSLIEHIFLNTKFQKDHLVFYFFIERKKEEILSKEFELLLRKKCDYVPELKTIQSFLEFVFALSNRQSITIILDEFQNFKYVNESVFSTLQHLWDKNHKIGKINLIAIGSLYSTMERIFSSSHEPLYGRTTGRIILDELLPKTLWEMAKDHRVTRLSQFLNLYSLFGGYPRYYDLLEKEKLFLKKPELIFRRLFLDIDAVLRDEGKSVLIEEFGPDYQTYFSILEVIASEKIVSNQKIGSLVGIDLNHVSTYLSTLEKKFNVIKRDVPILIPTKKSGRYRITSHLLRNWFRYIFKNQSLVESGQKVVVESVFSANFNSIKGEHFENLILSLVRGSYKDFSYKEWGRYWDKHAEIDIVGINRTEKRIFLGECQLGTPAQKLIHELHQKSAYIAKLLPSFKIEKAIFTASPTATNDADDIRLFNEEDIIRMLS